MKDNGTVHANLHSGFWDFFRDTIRREGIPYQWKALNDQVPGAAPSRCMRNFRIAAGKEQGAHEGFVFQDSDVYKWLESVAYALEDSPDPELEAVADGVIDEITAAQQPDGYLDTYYIINGLENRWTNLRDHHEMYCAGHLMEAAAAYYRATGKRKLLDAALRLADHIDGQFGPEEGKLRGYPGHPVIEMALVRLYELTGEKRYLNLAKFFLDERGQAPLYFEEETKRYGRKSWLDRSVMKLAYYQADRPVREQQDAVGHAVRALYLYSGMADAARETGDEGLWEACRQMWESVTERRMYITGAVGSGEFGEAFTFDYDLRNDLVYGETCAAVALVFFARRMLRKEIRGEYADVMERALYNGVLSGMQLDGRSYFYVNPLEVLPEACEKDQRLQHVKPVRQPWFGCACCPPNLNRLVMSLGDYMVSRADRTVYVHLYIGGTVETELPEGRAALEIRTEYPWDGRVRITVKEDAAFDLALRIPGWCEAWSAARNGERIHGEPRDGYLHLEAAWHAGDEVELNLEMPPVVIHAHPGVYQDAGLAAVMRGPLVYCLEEADNGKDLHLVCMGTDPGFAEQWDEELPGGMMVLTSRGLRQSRDGWDAHRLYAPARPEEETPAALRWIPYYAWSNRGKGEMRVWIHR